jgi:hypothetical protein
MFAPRVDRDFGINNIQQLSVALITKTVGCGTTAFGRSAF